MESRDRHTSQPYTNFKQKYSKAMLNQRITFDLFIRGLIVVAIVVLSIYMVGRLSTVLIPFFVAWLLAYMLYPLVCFLQYKARLRSRILSIVAALAVVFSVITGVLVLVVPPTIQEFGKVHGLLNVIVNETIGYQHITEYTHRFIERYVDGNTISQLAEQGDLSQLARTILSQLWHLITGTINLAIGVMGSFVVLLYTFFILLDYELICDGWANLIPAGKRDFAVTLVQDVKNGMNAYFRGQSIIAFLVGILFSIGFLIIDFPFAIGLGLFIGLLNLVPYLQLIAFLPTILLALLKAAETGGNFWLILLSAGVVFAVVQLIQDMYLTPKIMGKAMGLNPAIILLSLSVWGSLLGIIGLIIALPLTTLLLSYYRRFVLNETSLGPAASLENKAK